jgi:hypothetical protein
MTAPALGTINSVEQVAPQWLESLKPGLKQQLADLDSDTGCRKMSSSKMITLALEPMDAINPEIKRQLSGAGTRRRTTPEKSHTKQEPARVLAWLSEGSDEKGSQLRPAKTRAGWRSTSGLVAPPAVKHLVAPPPTRHFAVQHLQHAHSTNSMPSMKEEREIKPAMRRSSTSPDARRSGQRITFEEGAQLCENRAPSKVSIVEVLQRSRSHLSKFFKDLAVRV